MHGKDLKAELICGIFKCEKSRRKIKWVYSKNVYSTSCGFMKW